MLKKTTLIILCCLPMLLGAQINQMEFGKNRVQFHRFFDDWDQYESENFHSYWYGTGRFVGQATVQMAEMDYEEIQKILEYRLNDKVEIIVYTDLTDLHQSNIGSEETFVTKGGQVKVVGEKMFVHFDGDHTHLRRQVREGIAGVFLNAMMFGSNLQEMVQNAISLNLPDWYKEGLVSYIGEEWNTETDDQLRDVIQSKKYKTFNKFAAAEPRLAGHAFWYYVAHQFGKANVSNMLYLTRINRSLEDAVMYVTGNTFEPMSLAAMEFYRKRYEREMLNVPKETDVKVLKIKNKRKLPMPQVKLSPDGKNLAFVQNEIGKWKVYVQDIATGKREEILRGGTRNPFQATDLGYPLLAWNTDNQRLTVVYEKRDVVYLFEKNLKDKKVKNKRTKFNPEAQHVYSIDYLNLNDMVISANIRGLSDLFIYNTSTTNMRAVSNDAWDDLDAVAVRIGNKRGILFASNRPNERLENEKLDSILPIAKFDIFYKDLEDTSRNLIRVTNTRDADERQPAAVDTTFFTFLNDESGVFNRQMAYLKDVLVRTDTVFFTTNTFGEKAQIVVMQDSVRQIANSVKIDSSRVLPIIKKFAVVKNNTNRVQSIVAQSTSSRTGKVAEVVYTEGVPQVRILPLKPDSVVNPTFTNYWLWKQKKNQPTQKTNKTSSSNPSQVIDNQKVTTIPKSDIQNPTSNTPSVKNEKTADSTAQNKKKIDLDTYVFQSEFDQEEKPKTTEISTAPKVETPKSESQNPTANTPSVSEHSVGLSPSSLVNRVDLTGKKLHSFKPARITPYRLKFRSDYFSSKLDNNLLFGGLDAYVSSDIAGTNNRANQFNTPPMGILLKGNFKDLLEDYQLEGGIRIPTTFNGYEAFAFFDDRKHRLDKRFALYHRWKKTSDNLQSVIENRKSQVQTSLAQYEVRYPIDIFQRVQASTTLRNDRFTQLATDSTTLVSRMQNQQRIGARVEYVFDNSMDIDVNIKNGSRVKVWADWVKTFQLGYSDKLRLEFNNGFMGVLGFDARHYERVLKHSVVAVRFAGATSFGKERTLYVLGGIDNQLFSGYNDDVNTPAGNYAFQTLAANMRGFDRNIRNGTSNVVFNGEFRFPIFKYFTNKPTQGAFWRNFQLIGFVDAATAWHGSNPFRRDNPLNTIVLPKDNTNLTSVVLTVNYFKDPIVASYGVGARIYLFGYMFRADYGWGIETREVQKPKLHIALGTDF